MTTRERIRAAIGPCAGICPERHADLIAARVEQVRLATPELSDHLKSRAAALTAKRERDRSERREPNR